MLQRSRSLREQLRRARAKGVVVRALDARELVPGHAMRARLDDLIARWRRSRTMAPMGFLVQVDPFTLVEERSHFVAERDGTVVGFLGVVPIYASNGWFFEDLWRDRSCRGRKPRGRKDATPLASPHPPPAAC